YTAGTANARMSEISADPVTITADGQTQSTITVQLRDEFGNALTESIGPSAVTITHKGERTGDEYNSTAVDNGDGSYSVTVTSKQAGEDSFGFRVLTASGNGEATVIYTSGEASATQSEISLSPAIITADGEAESIVTVTLKDQFGNRLNSNGNATLRLTLSNNKGNITQELMYNGADTGQFTGKITSTAEGFDDVSFTLNGTLAGEKGTAKLEYRAGGYSLTTSTIELSKAEITADDVDSSIVTVTLRDQHQNIVTDLHDIRLVGLNNGHLETEGSLVLHSANNDGIYSGVITSRIAGEDTLRFSVDQEATSQDFKVITYIAGEASTETTTMTASPVSIVANGHDVATVTVQLRDKFGNSLNREIAQGVKLDATTLEFGESESGSLEMVYNQGGRYILTLKSTKAGVDQLNYILGASNEKGKTPTSLTYTAGSVSLVNSTITVDPEVIVADGITESTVTVQFKDAFGNNLTANAGRVILDELTYGELKDRRMTYQAGTGSYIGTIVSEKAGTDIIGYRIDGIGFGEETTTLTYISGAVDLNETTITADRTTIKADGIESATITVQLRDAKGNIVPEQAGEVSLLGLDSGVIVEAMTYQTNGRYEGKIASTIATTEAIGYQLSTEAGSSKNTVSMTYTPGDYVLEFSEITANPQSIEANGTTRSEITVQLKDMHGNNVLGNPTDVYVTALVYGEFSDQRDYRFTPQGNGRYTGYVTSKKVGSDVIGFTTDQGQAAG
ncbi:invasin domain 3-containing protein, partial [Ignatzschineria sp. LJL83]